MSILKIRTTKFFGRGRSQFAELQRLVPLIILVAVVCDVTFRLAPPEYVTFRAWEAATLFNTGHGQFRPNFFYDNPNAYGDLANLGNLRSLRKYRREVFTTDAFGYRNTPNATTPPFDMVIVGDSFGAGAGLSDGETLSSQLTELSGLRAYNGAGAHLAWPTLATLIERLPMKGGVVLWQHSERYDVPPAIDWGSRSPRRQALRSLMKRLSLREDFLDALRTWGVLKREYFGYSPLRILLRRAVGARQNDVVFPNQSARQVVLRRLKNNELFLFLTSEVDNFTRERSSSASFFVELQMLVRSTGNELLVVLVPDKYNVYSPLFDGETGDALGDQSFLRTISRNLARSQIPALDLTPALRDEAIRASQTGEYCYRVDDTHWNPRGVKRSAAEIVPLAQKLLARE